MTDAWQPDAKSGGSGDGATFAKVEYFHLKDGESADIRFLTEPITRWIHTIAVKGKNYPATCIESPTKCPAHQAGQKAKKIKASVVLDRRDGKVKLYEFSNRGLEKIKAVKDTVAALKPELQNPTLFDIKISRTGKTKDDTNYSMSLGANLTPLSEAEKNLQKPNLDEYYKENKERMETLLKGELPKRKEEATATTTNANPLENQNI